jgi:hypothetical protein
MNCRDIPLVKQLEDDRQVGVKKKLLGRDG